MLYQNTQSNMRTQMSAGCRNAMPDYESSCMPKTDMGYDCGARDGRMDQYPLAMAYVPWQKFGEVYSLDRGFHAGTIFPCLDLPFLCANPGCSRKGGRA